MRTQNPLRQKFINMMYLILIAMLFLNPPVEFIEIFSEINKTIDRANNLIDEQNQVLVKDLRNYTNEYNNQELRERLEKAEEMSDSSIHVLDTLKTFLLRKAGGYNKHNHIKGSADASLPTRLIYRTDRARKLKSLLATTKEKLMDVLNFSDRMMLDTVLITKDSIPKASGVYYDWDAYFFDNIPLGGVIATLTKFQNDVRIAQKTAYRNVQDSLGKGSRSPLYAQRQQMESADTTGNIDSIILEPSVKRFEVFNLGEKGITKIKIPDVPDERLKDATIYTYDEQGKVVDSTRFYSGTGEIELKTDEVGKYKVRGQIAMKDAQGKGPGDGPGPGGGGGSGDGKGPGEGPGTGPGEGPGSGEGSGEGTGPGQGPGSGEGAGEGAGEGTGQGQGAGTGQGGGGTQGGKGEGQGGGEVAQAGTGSGEGAGGGRKEGEGVAGKGSQQKDVREYSSKREKSFEFEYEVVNPKPYISQEKFNVFYDGVVNPIEIYHPLLDKRDHRVDITNGKILYKDGRYYARAYRTGRSLVTLRVRNEDGEMRKVAQRSFQVKELPKPQAILNKKSGGEVSARIFKMQKQLNATNTSLDINANYQIVGFDLTYISSQGGGMLQEEVRGSQFSGKARKIIDMAEKGDIYIFDEIKVKGPDGRNMKIDGIVFDII